MGDKTYVLQNSESATGKKDVDYCAGTLRIETGMENINNNLFVIGVGKTYDTMSNSNDKLTFYIEQRLKCMVCFQYYLFIYFRHFDIHNVSEKSNCIHSSSVHIRRKAFFIFHASLKFAIVFKEYLIVT